VNAIPIVASNNSLPFFYFVVVVVVVVVGMTEKHHSHNKSQSFQIFAWQVMRDQITTRILIFGSKSITSINDMQEVAKAALIFNNY
jgi:hypothetical protein